VSIASSIVKRLLETDEVDPKEFISQNSDEMWDVWEQVDGDMDWWTYGGTFHNAAQEMMVHVPGLESAGIKDIDPWDIELSEEELAQINAQFPVRVDPEFPEDGDENEDAREEAIDALKTKKAEEATAARKMPVYRWLDDHIEDYADKFPGLAEQMGVTLEEIENMPLGAKWSMLMQAYGPDEFDSDPDRYTYEEIKKYLTPMRSWRDQEREG
jgi:hypothetical protein